MIRASGLAKHFGARRALDGVTLEVPAGTAAGIVGPNGAGKTTLVRVLATLARPDSGEAVVAGADLREDPIGVRRAIGVCLHPFLLYEDLTAAENLRFAAALRGVDLGEDEVRRRLADLGLAVRAYDPVAALSRGARQRLSLARALVGSPRVLRLDEPLTGLDEDGRQRARGLLEKFVEVGGTLLATAHRESDLPMTSRVLRLSRGALEGG